MDYKQFFQEIQAEFIENKLRFFYDYDIMLEDTEKESLHLLFKIPSKDPYQCSERIFFTSYYVKNPEEFLSFLALELLIKCEKIPEFITNRLILSCWKNPWVKKFWQISNSN